MQRLCTALITKISTDLSIMSFRMQAAQQTVSGGTEAASEGVGRRRVRRAVVPAEPRAVLLSVPPRALHAAERVRRGVYIRASREVRVRGAEKHKAPRGASLRAVREREAIRRGCVFDTVLDIALPLEPRE